MRKKLLTLIFVGIMCCSLISCGQSNSVNLAELENRIAELETENEQLKKENAELSARNVNLESELNAKEQETTVQPEDVTVLLTGKSTSQGRLATQLYVDFVFTVTNNTDKTIKGVQGLATFKDIFDVEIIKISCDFTGITIEPGSSVTVSDLSLDCNPYIDDQSKLYTTAYDDLHFEYDATAIVFTDGTTKTIT